MLALVIGPPESSDGGPRLTLREDCPQPTPAPGEVLVRVRLAGICGTDLEIVRGYMGFAGVPGHEFVGEVVGGAPSRLAGRRVVGEINAGCGECGMCREGMARHCPNRSVLGILGRDGSFAEYLALPAENLLPVPDALADECAVFTEPLAAAFEVFEQAAFEPSDRVAILGDGRLGAMVAMALRARNLPAVIGGHHQAKLARLAAMGLGCCQESALTPGFDVVIECSGSATGLERALELVRPRGRIILKTTVAGPASLNLAPAVINEIEILGSRCGRFAPALEALAAGTVDPRPLIDEVRPLAQALPALASAADHAKFKILLRAA